MFELQGFMTADVEGLAADGPWVSGKLNNEELAAKACFCHPRRNNRGIQQLAFG